MKSEDGLGVIYHEAGHAVVALALRLRVTRVEVFDERNGNTHVERADHLELDDQLAICFGGTNATNMFNAPFHPDRSQSDLAKAVELVCHLDEAEQVERYDKGHQRAWELLEAYKCSVEDIAAQLLAHRKIDLTGYVLKR